MKVPKKNISSKIVDVLSPKDSGQAAGGKENKIETADFLKRQSSVIGEKEESNSVQSSKPPLKKVIFVFSVLVLVIGGISLLGFYQSRAKILNSLAANQKRLEVFGLLNNPSASSFPGENFQSSPPFDINKFWNFLKNAGETYGSLEKLSVAALSLSKDSSYLETNGLSLFLNRQGDQLIAGLQKIEDDVSSLDSSSRGLDSFTSVFPVNFLPPPSNILILQTNLNRLQRFLEALVAWLKAPGERRLLILLQNPSEMRPGGGFLGSYTVVYLKGGSLESVSVHDINEAARNLKIIPPQPLQALVSNWRPADANWFFDFPTSAEKIQGLMGSNFDAVIAVSPQVFKDILSLTGPLTIKDRNLTLDENNFLISLQREVELSQNQKATYPKEILTEIAPLLVQKLSSLNDTEKQSLFSFVADWFAKKDLMVYFPTRAGTASGTESEVLENFVDFHNASGKVFYLPQGFNGDYLAIVNANIGGGKTDLFIKQKISFASQLNANGTADDTLTITREHSGNKSPYWWYRLPNLDYLEVFTQPDAIISNFSGGWSRKIRPKINYRENDYQADNFVQGVEATEKTYLVYPVLQSFLEFGKNIFASWMKTEPGQKSQIVFSYENQLFSPPSEGLNYQFIFEKQAGAVGDYTFDLSAPVGYRWKENDLPVFEYKTSDPPGRLIIDLTLMKL